MRRTAAKKLGDTTRELAKCREAVSDIDKNLSSGRHNARGEDQYKR